MTKGKKMTLKQAAEWLKTTEFPYGFDAIKKAALNGKLKVQLMKDAPTPYYLVSADDILTWAADPEMHKAGRPAKG